MHWTNELALAGGGAAGLGLCWLFVEAMLRYSSAHGVRIVNWVGRRWPTNARQQREINERLDRSQERELRRLRQVRPVPIGLVVLGVVLIVVAAV